MSLAKDVDFLRKVPVFSGLDDDQLKLIAFNSDHRRVGQGQFLFRQGEAARSALVIMSGTVEALRDTGDAEAGEGRHGPGTVFGELAMIVDTQRPLSARALEPVEALDVPRHVFHRVLEEYPDIALRLRETLAGRVGALAHDLRAVAPRFAGDD